MNVLSIVVNRHRDVPYTLPRRGLQLSEKIVVVPHSTWRIW